MQHHLIGMIFLKVVFMAQGKRDRLVAALSRHVRKLPASLRRSLTWDRGLEMAKHKSFTVATNVKVYFCDPQSPGSAAPTKTPTGCCDNTSLRKPACPATLNPTSTR
jgi:hypothetical protein